MTDNITIDNITFQGGEKDTRFQILRLDKIDPFISGNKWFKLKYYIADAVNQKKKLLTFGGAWSNHILATAAACKEKGIPSAAVIRGEEPKEYSPVLLFAQQAGMKLFFVSREEFAEENLPGNISKDEYIIVPQGGYGIPGARGAAEILDHCNKEDYTHICCAAGTGTMAAGIVNASDEKQKIFVISVLKNHKGLEKDIRQLLSEKKSNWELFHEYHCGGYAKYSPGLISYMNHFYRENKVPTDFVYTGKLCYAISELHQNRIFPAGSSILIIHSGGLSGNASLKKGTLIFQ